MQAALLLSRAIVRLSNGLHRLVRRLAVAGLAAMLLCVGIQVVARYLFSAPPVWTEELARYMMVWSGLLGATLSFKDRADPVLLRDPSLGRGRALELATASLRAAAVLAFLLPVLYFSLFGPGLDPARGFLARTARLSADTLGFPMVVIAVAVPLSATIILVHLAARGCRRLAEAGRGDTRPPSH